MLPEKRVSHYTVMLTPSQRQALDQLAEREGSSGADVLRRLLLEEARRAGVLRRPGAAAWAAAPA